MTLSCTNQDCTVAATGKCLLLHIPPESCPNITVTAEPVASMPENAEADIATSGESNLGRRFFAGNELGTSDASEIMRARYGTVIAILGQYDVGKTCFLTSLYLLSACGELSPDLAFAGSLTLNGFEVRARRLRRWKGGALPKQLADHTRLADPRAPALLHLGLRERANEKRRFDLLITDLPGEWSNDLVKDAASAPRFDFLHRADGIVISLDGPMLAGAQRHAAAQSARLLLSRLSDTLKIDRTIPLVLMVTKCDELEMTVPSIVGSIEAHANSLGFSSIVIPVAAISRTPLATPSGTGVVDVVEHFLKRREAAADAPVREVQMASGRQFAKIRGLR